MPRDCKFYFLLNIVTLEKKKIFNAKKVFNYFLFCRSTSENAADFSA